MLGRPGDEVGGVSGCQTLERCLDHLTECEVWGGMRMEGPAVWPWAMCMISLVFGCCPC